MTEPLVSAAELTALAETAERGMQTEVRIFHKTDGVNDFSDDEAGYADDPDETVDGWLRIQPDFDLSDQFAALQHVEDGRLFLPRETSVARGDKVVIGGENFYVVDANTNNTFRVLTRVSLRRMD